MTTAVLIIGIVAAGGLLGLALCRAAGMPMPTDFPGNDDPEAGDGKDRL